VLADRSLVIKSVMQRECRVTRPAQTTYSGAGYEKSRGADLGAHRVAAPSTQALAAAADTQHGVAA
jgi:hypothetical protein